MTEPANPYVERGGTWRSFWIVTAALVVFVSLDVLLPGPDIAPLVRWLLLVVVLGIVAGGCLSARRVWTVLPLKLTDGPTVLVPTRDPAALRAALLAARGTLGP